jgi:hypothetical protein
MRGLSGGGVERTMVVRTARQSFYLVQKKRLDARSS